MSPFIGVGGGGIDLNVSPFIVVGGGGIDLNVILGLINKLNFGRSGGVRCVRCTCTMSCTGIFVHVARLPCAGRGLGGVYEERARLCYSTVQCHILLLVVVRAVYTMS